jgi:hypothetical protein
MSHTRMSSGTTKRSSGILTACVCACACMYVCMHDVCTDTSHAALTQRSVPLSQLLTKTHSVYVYVYTYIHTLWRNLSHLLTKTQFVYIYIYTYAHTYIHSGAEKHSSVTITHEDTVRMRIHIHIHIYTYNLVQESIHIHIYTYIYTLWCNKAFVCHNY